jgi:hypothetical protein
VAERGEGVGMEFENGCVVLPHFLEGFGVRQFCKKKVGIVKR